MPQCLAHGVHAQALLWFEQARVAAAAAGDPAGFARACENLGACYKSMGQYEQALVWNKEAQTAYAAVGRTAPSPPAGVDYASAPEAGAADGPAVLGRSVTPELVRANNGTLQFRRQNPAGVQARADAAPALHSAAEARAGPLLGNVFSSIPPPLPLYAAWAESGENPASAEDAPGDPEEETVLERLGDTRPLDPPGEFPLLLFITVGPMKKL